MPVVKISLYLIAFVCANFVVLYFGSTGLIFTALFLIPFDFIMRCVFHETWKGKELIFKLGALVSVASLLTFLINHNTLNIATGSMCGFAIAQIFAGVFYQLTIKKPTFVKVNGSDAIGIIADSIVFQFVAFGFVDYEITVSQVAMKLIGGLFWYYVIFKIFKFNAYN